MHFVWFCELVRNQRLGSIHVLTKAPSQGWTTALNWNQTPFVGEAADLINRPNMFKECNRMEAKCRSYLQKVPKARSAEIIAERRQNMLHNDVCQRLHVEINARVMQQGMIATAIRDGEQNGYDPWNLINNIKMDPQYATDPELSDYSDDE
ncbi:hypothetical protein RHMOL_Rhmol10G0212200 [Rhododendron molle]|uniref:Uncharacterized protein n=1 Tax=Rhododendron molle TaxID=49168 RepID=A0ACC0M5R4_RHOML|nr:hypothetical protein RHMOL_Rhmol10G0212200 [Rhododendron molle]